MTDAAIKKPDSGIAGEFAENLGLITPLARAWHFRELIRAVVRRELMARFSGSILGWLWAIFGPLLMLSVYTVIFSHAVGIRASTAAHGVANYSLNIFVGLIVFNLFGELAYRAPGLLHEHVNFIKKSIFPSETLAWTAAIRAAVYAAISFCVLLVFELLITHKLPPTILLLPFVFVPFFLFLLGVSWFLMALGSFTRDVMHLMASIVPVFMFATPIFYSIDDVPGNLKIFLRANIVGDYVELTRDVVLLDKIPNPWLYLGTVIVSLLVFRSAYRFYMRYKNVFVDVI
ncbi:ABC transporter [Methylovirgula ligni]|uniref:Lipopolysaccharide transport system permease protein n=1 Tax=Methylovirgula ligni TaxID=569860 RepID=A0A3D9YQ31_9HYPH|nr:ABC transporter permease [Methylovirgula ligni]QAY94855.1 ABC transporter [Methylovirgula ligni]REF84720.1 lipopolysaccharide transport system permease protein [Methylovirgula ligni]